MSEVQTKLMPMPLLGWRPLRKNTLRGFACVPYGRLKILEVSLHEQNGKRWVSLPGKPLVLADGTVVRDDKGKIRYVQILEWSSRESADRFSAGVWLAVETQYPDDVLR